MTKEELYKKAKEEYYKGTPIMSDREFDELEMEVGVGAVGASDPDAKFPHPTKMLSLSKFQADKTTGTAPTQQVIDWAKGIQNITKDFGMEFEVTCKYDGNSGNCIYKDGKLVQVLTRGDGFAGRDITNKIKHIIPNTISANEGVCEVRGEIIMRKSVFAEKYKDKFANPRNLVAGILGRDDDAMIEDLSFIAYDCKYDDEYKDLAFINKLNFNENIQVFNTTWNLNLSFDTLFEQMVLVREQCDFPLDGFVLKTDSKYRSILGENDHDPEWGKAIKFKPVGEETEVIDVEWNIGKTGEFIPKAILKPVDVDGSTVSKVALYNAGYVVNNNIEVGTKVRIAKAGDIIPQIIEIFK